MGYGKMMVKLQSRETLSVDRLSPVRHGLVVTRHVADTLAKRHRHGYVVTHVATTRKLPGTFRRVRDARQYIITAQACEPALVRAIEQFSGTWTDVVGASINARLAAKAFRDRLTPLARQCGGDA